MSERSEHITVLLHEAVDALAVKVDGVYVDGTFGRGGHSRLILQRLGQEGRLVVFDKDPQAVAVAEALAKQDKRVSVIHEGFATLKQSLARLEIHRVDGMLLDLGISSPQIDEGARGFSFRFDAPLDMRMDTTRGQTAEQWLNEANEKDIQEVIKTYGEERFSRQIAAAIVARRKESPIRTTLELASLVAGVVFTRERGQNPATRTFQAIRIFINRELDELTAVLPQVAGCLKEKGRMALISFHSLEDRIVKQFLKRHSENVAMPKWAMIKQSDLPLPPLVLLGKGQKPSDKEIKLNPRARSARLRVAERTASVWVDDE